MKDILILCNGKPPSNQLMEEYHASADYLIVADGLLLFVAYEIEAFGLILKAGSAAR